MEAIPSLNSSMSFNNDSVTRVLAHPRSGLPWLMPFINVVYVLGILGNAVGLRYILHPRSKSRNPRHSLLLTLLLSNDLTAMVGMCGLMYLKYFCKDLARTRGYCMARVLLRAFGLGSGCIVFVMAVERFMALSRPFYYTKHVTVSLLRKTTLTLWFINLGVVLLPIFGIGAYYDEQNCKCVRYKSATQLIDIVYAYVYMGFGLLLCIGLVVSNSAVVATLTSQKNNGASKPHVLVRRHSRNKDLVSASTAEEAAFARVMIYISASFLFAWLPQLATVPVAHLVKNSQSFEIFFILADTILALHFIIDPYIYILQKFIIFKPSQWCRKPSSRTSSVKTSNELCSL